MATTKNAALDVRIGDNIRRLRNKHKISQERLATELGVAFQQVQKYETGRNSIRATTLLKLANFFGVALTYFFREPKENKS